MAGNKTYEGKVLAEVQSTPHHNRDGVVVKIPYAALAKYEVNVRSFHPNKQFERGGFRFHGDDRGFSLEDSYFGQNLSDVITSRIWQRYLLDADLKTSGDLTRDIKGKLKQESNPSSPGPGLWSAFGNEEPYKKEKYKPRGKLTATDVSVPHGGQKKISMTSWYGGENHAFLFSRTAVSLTNSTFVPTLDTFSEIIVRVERVSLYMDILSLVYGDGFPNCEAFIKDAAGNKLFLGSHVRIGLPATHLFGENHRLMWANAIRVEIDEKGNFGERLWVFAQILGGPLDLRDEYPITVLGEVCMTSAKKPRTISSFNVIDKEHGKFIWDCGNPANVLTPEKNSGLPLYLSAYGTPINMVRSFVEATWEIGPRKKTTRIEWNNEHLHRDPNQGRSKDDYDISPDKWKEKP